MEAWHAGADRLDRRTTRPGDHAMGPRQVIFERSCAQMVLPWVPADHDRSRSDPGNALPNPPGPVERHGHALFADPSLRQDQHRVALRGLALLDVEPGAIADKPAAGTEVVPERKRIVLFAVDPIEVPVFGDDHPSAGALVASSCRLKYPGPVPDQQ